jgi:Zn-dependent peptidase ImmA (M78 family)/DNA-binding XRE family transcriptional regulator
MPSRSLASWVDVGRRVAEARKAADLSQEELAGRLGLDRTAVSKIESGDRRVDTLELAQLARELGRSIEWFVTEPPAAIVSRRGTAAEPKSLRVDAILEELAQDVELLFDLGVLKPPDIRRATRRIESVGDAEAAALEFRENQAIAAGPLRDIQGHAERFGLYAFSLNLPSGFDGASLAVGRGGVALINGGADPGRRRFTLAHEVGHHLLADEYSADFDVTAGAEERERLINAFAIHLLMPRPSVGSRWKELVGTLGVHGAAITVSAEYGVSWSASIPHLQHLDLIAPSECAELLGAPPKRADYLELGVEVIPELEPPRVPRLYAAAVVKAYKLRAITLERALELFHGALKKVDLPALDKVPFLAVTDA